jgi:hypothetical protein
MKKELLCFASLMLGACVTPLSNSYHDVNKATAKKLSEKVEDEVTCSKYLATEASRNSAEQRQVESRIASFVSRTTSTTDEEEAAKFDKFFNLGSAAFWELVGANFIPYAANDFVDYAELAMEYAVTYYGHNKSDDASDAFRHVYLVAMITANYDAVTAREFCNLYSGYAGTDVAQSIRSTMDNHNNSIGITLGLQYPGYSYSMSGPVSRDIAKFATHAVKYGSYFDIYEMTADDLGLVHTTRGYRNSLFPPYC